MDTERLLEKLKKIPISIIVTSLFSGIVGSGYVYLLTKGDNHQIWCTQEIKSLDINQYRNKDLSIILSKCPEEIKEYELFEDILFNSDNTNKFSSFINQMYVNNKIDEKTIVNFSDNALLKKIRNEKYNFDNTIVNTQNNLPELNPQITKYLQFTQGILFKSYADEQKQLSNYFNIFLILFEKDKLFPYSDIPSYHRFLKENNQSVDIKVSEKLLDLQKIVKNSGNVDKRKFIINSKDQFIVALAELFSSYKNENEKGVLINRLSSLVQLIEKNETIDKHLITNENQWHYINEKFIAGKITQLIFLELHNYKLEDTELESIFHEYITLTKYMDIFAINTTDKLVQQLFTEKFSSDSLNKEELYRQLFFDNYKNKIISLRPELLNYLAIKNQIDLLMDILKLDSNNPELKSQIFHALMTSQLYHKNYVIPQIDYSDILIDMIKNEQNKELQRLLLRDSLELDSIEIIEFAINYINTNQAYYIKELNENTYFGSDFHLMSIFRYLSDTKVSWVSKQKEIKKKKFDLFITFMNATQNKDNKIKLFDCAIKATEKNDIFLIEQLKSIMSNEKDMILKEEMLSKFSAMKLNT